MLKYFACPDSESIVIEDCIKHCRMQDRCVSLPLLSYFAEHRRVWTGKPSTTQLIQPLRSEYLKIKFDYAESPDSMVYKLLGLNIHRKLEKTALPSHLQEEFLEDEISTGFMDSYDGDTRTLWDYKTIGYYKAKKIIEDIASNVLDWALQLNRYRMLLEKAGFPVERMCVQAIIRDFGWMAKKAGVTKAMYIIPIHMIEDEKIESYFGTKASALLSCLETNTIPPVCDDRWDNDSRCKNYCAVKSFCDYGRDK